MPAVKVVRVPAPPEAVTEATLVLQCGHSCCHAEDVPGAAAECRSGYARCCGCCAPDWDSAWEDRQDSPC
jgi:hypothetical protein